MWTRRREQGQSRTILWSASQNASESGDPWEDSQDCVRQSAQFCNLKQRKSLWLGFQQHAATVSFRWVLRSRQSPARHLWTWVNERWNNWEVRSGRSLRRGTLGGRLSNAQWRGKVHPWTCLFLWQQSQRTIRNKQSFALKRLDARRRFVGALRWARLRAEASAYHCHILW